EPFLCDVHSALHELEFTFRLHAAQSVHDWRKTRVAMQRIFAPAPFDESHVAALHLNRCAVMLVGIEIYLFNIASQHDEVEQSREFGSPHHCIYSGSFHRLLLRELLSFPCRDFFVGLSNKKNLAVFLVGKSRGQYQDCFFLIYTGEIEQVAVLTKAYCTIRICWHYIIRIDNNN